MRAWLFSSAEEQSSVLRPTMAATETVCSGVRTPTLRGHARCDCDGWVEVVGCPTALLPEPPARPALSPPAAASPPAASLQPCPP